VKPLHFREISEIFDYIGTLYGGKAFYFNCRLWPVRCLSKSMDSADVIALEKPQVDSIDDCSRSRSALPPLRDQLDDIPVHVADIARVYPERMRRDIRKSPAQSMLALQRDAWPGNILELRNVVGQATMLTFSDVLSGPGLPSKERRRAAPLTLEEGERSYIEKTLCATNGVIGGPNGGAARLGIPQTMSLTKCANEGSPE
jgi:hypothetical protein